MQDLKLFLGVFVSFAVVYYFLHWSTMSSMSKSLPGLH
ncbi:YER053C-A [Zygosaccharomyces parabailii]|nr:YER053C-A [Zygosaccharomyces parabailii]